MTAITLFPAYNTTDTVIVPRNIWHCSPNPIPQSHERPAGWRQAQRRKWNRRTGIFPTR